MGEIKPLISPEQVQALTAQLTGVVAQIKVAFKVMADSYIEAMRRVIVSTEAFRKHLLAQQRDHIGGNGSDAYDPLWQSAVCSAWLHQSCPDVDGKLECSCDCHRA